MNNNFNKIKKGFDRDVDFEPIKEQLTNEYIKQADKYLTSKYKKLAGTSVIYILISMIQLRNGSRISEAIDAFKLFLDNGIKDKVVVKIAKSGAIKYKKGLDGKYDKNEKFLTKERFRKMMFPENWIDTSNIDELFKKLKESHIDTINSDIIRINIVGFMKKHFKTNTHSLRYAFINYMIYTQKRPLNDVAKFVGHVNVNQLVTYTQQKNCEQIFDLDI
jgi:hypothetical protein